MVGLGTNNLSVEGSDIEDVSKDVGAASDEYQRLVGWFARDLNVTTLRCRRVGDRVEAHGMPGKEVCVYCWTGECPRAGEGGCGKEGE